eukprot:654119-Prymnesium_polylepis.1
MAAPMTKSEKTAAAIAAAHPLGRLGTPEDSAAMAAFLLSEEASWITGQVALELVGRSAALAHRQAGQLWARDDVNETLGAQKLTRYGAIAVRHAKYSVDPLH